MTSRHFSDLVKFPLNRPVVSNINMFVIQILSQTYSLLKNSQASLLKQLNNGDVHVQLSFDKASYLTNCF